VLFLNLFPNVFGHVVNTSEQQLGAEQAEGGNENGDKPNETCDNVVGSKPRIQGSNSRDTERLELNALINESEQLRF